MLKRFSNAVKSLFYLNKTKLTWKINIWVFNFKYSLKNYTLKYKLSFTVGIKWNAISLDVNEME